ncbi:FKBP-type peptidyl-prolyl cis-trans isomerase [Thalassolituus sp. LLYu03]|uniref:FKBP-type peptidyl-prolyl cis-trans isomerase n=1 Tax=Thalassolituus sp. LLYu03 TaxID=3421656 RepID=UPI003D2CED70
MLNLLLGAIIVVLVIYALRRAGALGGGKAADEQIADGERFLAGNKTREGVTETASGLQYEMLSKGTGERHPGPRTRVLVHYHGTLLNGTVFDSSVQRNEPIAFGLNQVIAGWTEGVQLMVEGDKTRFWIPSRLAYGNQRVGNIPPGSVLIFDVELLSIQD